MRAIDVALAILPFIGHCLCAPSTESSSRYTNSTSSVQSEGTTQNPTRSTLTAQSTITAPANLSLTGAAYARSCNSASISWSVANASWYTAHSPTSGCSSFYTPTTFTGSSSDINPEYTTLCDGHARLPEDYEWPTYTNVTSVLDTTRCPPMPSIPTFTEPTPKCSVPAKYCTQFWSEFATKGGWMYANTDNPPPPCSTSSGFYPGCEKCYISAYELQLFYWPVTTTGGNSCYQDGTTVTAKPTGDGPNTRVVDGFTMTSPSVYLAFQNIAASAANMSCGPDITSTTIAMDPTDVYSLSRAPVTCFNTVAPGCSLDASATTRVNFGDLNWPVPFSAYKAMGQCSVVSGEDTCHNMTLPLMPELALPTWLPNVFPAWKNCKPMPTGVYDPPKALLAVTAIEGPMMTLSGSATSTVTSADPSKTADPPFATSTATTTALEDQQGSSSADPSPQSSSVSSQAPDPSPQSSPASSQAPDPSPPSSPASSQAPNPAASSQYSADPSILSTVETTTAIVPASTIAVSASSAADPSSQLSPSPASAQALSSSTSTGGLGGWIFSGLGGVAYTTETVIVSTSNGAEVSTTSTIVVAESLETTGASSVETSGGNSPAAATSAESGDPTETVDPTSTVTGIGGIIASLVGQMHTSTLGVSSQASPAVMTIAVASTQDIASLISAFMQLTPSSYADQGTTTTAQPADPEATSSPAALAQSETVSEIAGAATTYKIVVAPSDAAKASDVPSAASSPAAPSALPQHESVFEIAGAATTYKIVVAPSNAAEASDVPSTGLAVATISNGNTVYITGPAPSSGPLAGAPLMPGSTATVGTNGSVSDTMQTYTLDPSQFSAFASAMSLDPAAMSSLEVIAATTATTILPSATNATTHLAASPSKTSATSVENAQTGGFSDNSAATSIGPPASVESSGGPRVPMSSSSSSTSQAAAASASISAATRVVVLRGLCLCSVALISWSLV